MQRDMTRHASIRAAAALSILATAGTVRAIVVADYATAESPPSAACGLDWSPVHEYKKGSAVAVDRRWLLTAAHLANDPESSTVVIGGTNYTQIEIVFHRPADDPANADRADLALVRLDRDLPGWAALYDGGFPSAPPSAKREAVLVGFGRTGAVFSAHYVPTTGGRGVRRWGTQRIDGPDVMEHSDEVSSWTNQGFEMQFHLADTAHEAGAAVYDSGGGTFVEDAGGWKLAGINANTYSGPSGYTGIFAVSVPAYRSWIDAVLDDDGDLDGDGLPNGWERRFGTTTGLTASADSDADGFTNRQEWIADTDPTNASSALVVRGARLEGASHILTFHGSTDRVYRVYTTTNHLPDPVLQWQPVTEAATGGSNTAIAVTNAAGEALYRIGVSLP